jgi:2'-hydroxyisoflavone reductase
MRILILGGTRFLGRHIVEAALAREHEVTLFNRGGRPRSSSRR